ncbi:MAG: glycosyltransferase [Candidatus Paracaedimonas acanthamoebae]|uniref:Glycosyltransferase n=1 Tax=Candidatus Paracaedimonas acanthamoebae TaxID=244581 RepID=A0A8J7PHA5_9PROT|nr:glycosyltransferase [Candidatus Paracaedimonas acanthamoebae]
MIRKFIKYLLSFLAFVILGSASFLARWRKNPKKPALLWGTTPLKSILLCSEALKEEGYVSHTVIREIYPILDKKAFDFTLFSSKKNFLRSIINQVYPYYFFIISLFKYDIFHFFFDGGILANTPLVFLEFPLLKFAKKKLVLIPYGSDTFVFDKLQNPLWKHALLINHPHLSKKTKQIENAIHQGTKYADTIIGCLVHLACLPRWDILPLVPYPIDLNRLDPALPKTQGNICIAHAPNHRGAKGTEFIIKAIEQLKTEGYPIKFLLIENKTTKESLALIKQADIFIDQLIFGFALAALEALAYSKIVITGVDLKDSHYKLFSYYSYLNDCPIIPTSPEDIYEKLLNLIKERDQWTHYGQKSRQFVEKYHSYKIIAQMYKTIYQKVYHGNDSVDLINYFSPK